MNPYPNRLPGCEKFFGATLDGDTLDALRDAVRSRAKPMRTTTVQPWYRRRVVGALARRLVAELAR